MATIRYRVETCQVDPLMRDRIRRWLVTGRILEVLEGEVPGGVDELSLLVHSPSRDFRDVEIVGREYALTLTGAFADPYSGPFTVQPGA